MGISACIKREKNKDDGVELSNIQWQGKKQWAQTEIKGISFKHQKKLLYSEGGQTLEQTAHRCCGVSILGNILDLTIHCPEQPALANPELCMTVGLDNLLGSFQTHLHSDSRKGYQSCIINASEMKARNFN